MNLLRVETPEDIRALEAAFDTYISKDIMPHIDLGETMTEDDLRYFRSDAYRNNIAALCARDTDPVHRYFVVVDGVRIGFILCCTYHSEDGKCFVMEMSIDAAHRGRGYGKAAFALLMAEENAAYYALHTAGSKARRFWESLGFLETGTAEDGSLAMVRPPQ